MSGGTMQGSTTRFTVHNLHTARTYNLRFCVVQICAKGFIFLESLKAVVWHTYQTHHEQQQVSNNMCCPVKNWIYLVALFKRII